MNTVQTITPEAGHSIEDYVSAGELRPEAIRVRLVRRSGLSKNDTPTLKHRWFEVEIDLSDRQYTFETEVAAALERRGFKVWTAGRGNGITVYAPNYRAPRGFNRVEDLSARA